MKFRKLKASEIECRVSTIKNNGLSLLLYKDARCDMRILDEEFGAEFWKRDHKEIKGNVYCGVSLYVQVRDAITEKLDGINTLIEPERYEWVTKWDAGAESYTEKVKGEASDSFKRACFNWGIGRELYTSPFIWITPKKEKEFFEQNNKFKTYSKFNVFDIEYKNDSISYLAIKDQDGEIRYTYGKPIQLTKEQHQKLLDLNLDYEKVKQWTDFLKYKVNTNMSMTDIYNLFSKKHAEFMLNKFTKENQYE